MPTKVKYTKLRGPTYHLNIPIPPTIQAKYGGTPSKRATELWE